MARAYLRGSNGGRSVRGDRAVWTGPDVDMFGRVSPDGTFITYVDWGGAGQPDAAGLDHRHEPAAHRLRHDQAVLGVCGRLHRVARQQGGRLQLVRSGTAPGTAAPQAQWLACAGSDRPVRDRRRRRVHLADGLVSRRQVDCGGGEPEGRHRADRAGGRNQRRIHGSQDRSLERSRPRLLFSRQPFHRLRPSRIRDVAAARRLRHGHRRSAGSAGDRACRQRRCRWVVAGWTASPVQQ